MATFVLVHGAWHGGWCWEEIVPLLEHDGHRVIAPDLPGMGRDRTPLSSITLAGWADFVADLIRAEPEPVILVGHSRGGIVISEVAERVPERIRRLVYLAAFLPPSGATLRSLSAQSKAPRNAGMMVMSEDGATSTVATNLAGAIFYNTTDAATIERAATRLTPEPMVTFVTPVQLTEARFGSVPRAY
ncbi:MAG: alpha/beta fold hydrolase, partial [Janthinobacterium lividum]